MNTQEHIQRIKKYERLFDEAVLTRDPEKLRQLDAYYTSGQWMDDYEADERGQLPPDLKRGVLSQDALYDLLTESDFSPAESDSLPESDLSPARSDSLPESDLPPARSDPLPESDLSPAGSHHLPEDGLTIAGRYGNPAASTVLIQMVDDHDLKLIESEVSMLRQLTDHDFCLTALKIHSWNDDLSPWPAPAVFGREGFAGGAPGTLTQLLKHCTDPGHTYILGGYSLAGLFALWAAYQTGLFTAVAAASPSVWFPGFTDYMKEHRPGVDSVYLSLGDKEEKTRNPVMASVGDRIQEAHELLKQQHIPTVLEWNPGNHFKNPDQRMAKAFAWALKSNAIKLVVR